MRTEARGQSDMEKGPWAEERRWPPETEKGKETNSSLGP